MRTIKIKLIILCCIFFLWRGKNYAQFFITPGQNQTIVDPCLGFPSSYSWSWDCSQVVNIVDNENAQTFSIPSNITCCKVKFSAKGKCNGIWQNFQQTFNVLPVINPAPSVVFPNQTFAISTSAGGATSANPIPLLCGGAGGLNCASEHGCPNATITWQVNGATPVGGTSGSCFLVQVPNNASITSPIIINANYNCNTAHALGPVSVNVALYNPSISGNQSIGCNPQYVSNISSNTFLYSASTIAGASYWNWTWPAGMTPTNPGNIHGQTISLDVISGSGVGAVTVQAFSADGTVSSGLVSYPVNICCVPVVNDNTTLNSGNAGYLKEAGSTINSTNDIQSTATATMHAGAEIRLLPTFNALQGSQVHLYNSSCNTGYMRLMPSQTTVDNTVSSGYILPKDESISFASYKATQTKSNTNIKEANSIFRVMPNPTNGELTISLSENSELPSEVTVIDGYGKVIQKTERIADTMFEIDLSNYANGIYAIRATYKNHVETKLVVKNSK